MIRVCLTADADGNVTVHPEPAISMGTGFRTRNLDDALMQARMMLSQSIKSNGKPVGLLLSGRRGNA